MYRLLQYINPSFSDASLSDESDVVELPELPLFSLSGTFDIFLGSDNCMFTIRACFNAVANKYSSCSNSGEALIQMTLHLNESVLSPDFFLAESFKSCTVHVKVTNDHRALFEFLTEKTDFLNSLGLDDELKYI